MPDLPDDIRDEMTVFTAGPFQFRPQAAIWLSRIPGAGEWFTSLDTEGVENRISGGKPFWSKDDECWKVNIVFSSRDKRVSY